MALATLLVIVPDQISAAFIPIAPVDSNLPSNAFSQSSDSRAAQVFLRSWSTSEPFCELGLQIVSAGDYVRAVRVFGPAAQAGVSAGDWILSVNGRVLSSTQDLDTRAFPPGTVLSIDTYSSNSGNRSVAITCDDGQRSVGLLLDLYEVIHRGLNPVRASGGHFEGRRALGRCVDAARALIRDGFYSDFQSTPLMTRCLLSSIDHFDDATWDAVSLLLQQIDRQAIALFDNAPICEFGNIHSFMVGQISFLATAARTAGYQEALDELLGALDPRWVDVPQSPEPQCEPQSVPDGLAESVVSVSGDPIAALAEAANFGDSEAMLLLGWAYWDGDGVEANRSTALNWWRRAARDGNDEARDLVAQVDQQLNQDEPASELADEMPAAASTVIYPQDPMPQQSPGEAARSRSEELIEMADTYRMGVGRPRNYVLAYALYSVAAAQGSALAASRLDALEGAMPADAISEAQELAAEFWEGDWSRLP
jgi:TPR repeat protein